MTPSVKQLARELNVLPTTAQLLINRGHTDPKEAHDFLHPKLNNTPDPFLLPDMERGAVIAARAIIKNQKIAIYGDYDVDGLTATAIIARFLTEIGITPRTYIPHRLDEGYGLHLHALDKLKEEGVDLMITVDTGATATDALRHAKEIGLEVVVTDHHHMADVPSDEFCIINPARPDSKFKERGLAGVTVAFLFVMALRQKLRTLGRLPKPEPHLGRMINLAALGVIADIVPMVGFNRILAKFGLKGLSAAHQPGLRELVKLCGTGTDVRESHVSFRIAPRINAAGRMGEVESALDLLLTEDDKTAEDLAARLSQLNSKRQREEEKLLKMAMVTASENQKPGAVVVWGDDWHPGVIGIVASKLVSKFKKPSAVISMVGDVGKGSIRGIGTGNIIEALSSSKDILLGYGGHAEAAGFSIEKKHLAEFASQFSAACEKFPKPSTKSTAEIEVPVGDLSPQLAKEIGLLSPFGPGNPEPTFLIKRKIVESRIVAEKHLKLWLDENGTRQEAIAFNMADKLDSLGKNVAFIATPRPNYFGGRLKLELVIKEFV